MALLAGIRHRVSVIKLSSYQRYQRYQLLYLQTDQLMNLRVN
jgi:hypothetical protein